MILEFSLEKHLIKKTRKLIQSIEGKKLEEEFEIILFNNRDGLIKWVYNLYSDIIDIHFKLYNNNSNFMLYHMNNSFLYNIKHEADKWYNNLYADDIKLYIPYYYQTTVFPIIKRLHKQKAFL